MYITHDDAKKFRINYFMYPGISVNEDLVLDIVCKEFKITLSELKAKKRLRNFGEARKAAAYFLRAIFKYRVEYIGTILKKDHSTITYYLNEKGVGSWTSTILYDKNLQEIHERISAKLESLLPHKTNIVKDNEVSPRLRLKKTSKKLRTLKQSY